MRGREDAVLEELEAWVDETVTTSAVPSMRVTGVIDYPETEFDDRLREIVEPERLENETVSVDHVTAHPVVQAFEERLAKQEWDEETREAVRTRTLRAASKVTSARGFE
jgi:hypothetical protein